jgi:hypothetical protein
LRQASAQRSPILSRSLGRRSGAGASSIHLLVAPLHRAVALAKIDRVAVLVGEYLHLDVPRVLEVLLHVDGRIRERRPALRLASWRPR